MAITDDSSLANLHFLPPGDDLPDILCLDRIHIDGCSSSWSLAYASYASWQSVQKEWMLRLAPPLDMKSAAENEGRDGTILHDPTLWRLRAKCSPRME